MLLQRTTSHPDIKFSSFRALCTFCSDSTEPLTTSNLKSLVHSGNKLTNLPNKPVSSKSTFYNECIFLQAIIWTQTDDSLIESAPQVYNIIFNLFYRRNFFIVCSKITISRQQLFRKTRNEFFSIETENLN